MPLKIKKRHKGTTWYIVGTVNGCKVDRSTKTRVQSIAEQMRAKLEVEMYQEKIYGQQSTALFVDAVNIYLKGGRSRRFLKPLILHFGGTPLKDIDQMALDEAAHHLYPGRSDATINRQLYAPMSAILKYAAKRKLCQKFDIQRRREGAVEMRKLSSEEASRLIEHSPPHLATILLFLLHTGARVGEALKLQWSQVDLVARRVTFVAANTKAKKTRTVPLSQALASSLAALPFRTGAVMRTHDGREYTLRVDAGGQFKTAFRTACRKAGIDGLRPHDLRHTWATWHYSLNRDLIALQQLGGWQDYATLRRYAQADLTKFEDSINALPDLIAVKKTA